jgi:hypothetical protein
MRKLYLLLLPFLLIACQISSLPKSTPQSTPQGNPATTTTPEVVPIPETTIQIEGVLYTAWQVPGDPFRFVCQTPCPLDMQYVYAEYAGFKAAHAMLLLAIGIDTLPELQPVDMHLELTDSTCGDLPIGHASIYQTIHQAYTCTQGPGIYSTLEEQIQAAPLPENQYFPLHEYMHTIFFGRISANGKDFNDVKTYFFHDYVVSVPSFAVGVIDPAEFCNFKEPSPPGDFGGYLIHELCLQNGFKYTDLAPSLVALDALIQSGGGLDVQPEYAHPVPTIAQYRDILNQLLGSDTTPAFAAACWPPQLFGNSYTLTGVCAPAPQGTSTAIH